MVPATGGVRNYAHPDRGAVTIGRSEDGDASIDDGSVSRRRSRIDVADGELTVSHLFRLKG